jgi:hypothetical protein
VVRNKARVERARNFFGITHVRDLTAVRDVGFGAKKGSELGGGSDAGVMSSHNPLKSTFSELDRLSSGRGQYEQCKISLKKWCSLTQKITG